MRGYHIYKDIWEASIGEELPCQREGGNHADPFAVAIVKRGVTVSFRSLPSSLLKCMMAARAPWTLPYVAILAFFSTATIRYVPRFFGRASAFFTSLLTSVSREGETDRDSEGSMPVFSIGCR